MIYALYLLLSILSGISIMLIAEFIDYDSAAFLHGFTIVRLFAFLIDVAIHFSSLYWLMDVYNGHLNKLYTGNILLFSCVVIVLAVVIVCYYAIFRKWLYYVLAAKIHTVEKVSVPVNSFTSKGITLLYTVKYQKRIFLLPLTDVIVIGRNFSKLSPDALRHIVIAESLCTTSYSKQLLLRTLALFMLAIAGYVSFQVTEGVRLHTLIWLLIGVVFTGGAKILSFIKFTDLRYSDRRAAIIIGNANLKKSLSEYYAQQTDIVNRDRAFIIVRELSKRLSWIG